MPAGYIELADRRHEELMVVIREGTKNVVSYEGFLKAGW